MPHTSGEREGEAQRPFVVAIDGPAASGKGTLARRLAGRFGFAHLDTGALYRATAFLVLDAAGDPADPATAEAAARRVDPGLLSDPRLRRDEVAGAASVVAAIPEVRRTLLALQREFAAHPPHPWRGAVLDGRDIGTVVCCGGRKTVRHCEHRARPSPGQRVANRAPRLYENVLQDLKQRDARDSDAGLPAGGGGRRRSHRHDDARRRWCSNGIDLVARTLKEGSSRITNQGGACEREFCRASR